MNFGNVSGTDFAILNNGSSSSGVVITTPTAAADGSLVLAFLAVNAATLGVTYNSDIGGVTETLIDSYVHDTVAESLQSSQFQISGTPAGSYTIQESTDAQQRAGILVVVSGHNTVTPIRDKAKARGTGTGGTTTVTFPDTGAVVAGDKVFRTVSVFNPADNSIVFSSFTETECGRAQPAGAYKQAIFLGYKTMGADGAPGTASLTISGNYSWVAQTTVLADAGAVTGQPAADRFRLIPYFKGLFLGSNRRRGRGNTL